DVIVRAQIEPAHLVGFIRPRRQHNDGDGSGRLFTAKAAAEFVTVHPRQVHVENDEVRPVGALVCAAASLPAPEGGNQAFLPAQRNPGSEGALAFEVVADTFGNVGIVLNDQNLWLHTSPCQFEGWISEM